MAEFDNRPWIPRPMPMWIVKELVRRKNDFGINYANNKVGWGNDGEWKTYKGPMMPWIRMCSNGTGQSDARFTNNYSISGKSIAPKNGFIMYGGMGFEDAFGIKQNKTILGYDVDGNPHIIPMNGSGFNYKVESSGSTNANSTPMYLPPPGIISLETTTERQFIREMTVRWNCYGFAQLEYLSPYFLNPNITMIVEYGWNHFNPNSLLNLDKNATCKYNVLDSDGKEVIYKYGGSKDDWNLRDLWDDQTPLYYNNVRISRGMYDAIFGSVLHFEYSTQDGIKYECSTKIGTKNRPYGGVVLDNIKFQKNGNNSDNLSMTFGDFVEKRLTKIKNCIIKKISFFDPLDDEEGKDRHLSDSLKSLKNIFYKDNKSEKIVENRVFIGRLDAINNNSNVEVRPLRSPNYSNHQSSVSDGDWDCKTSDEVWVTMGFIIDLLNFFCTTESKILLDSKETFKFFELKDTDSYGKKIKFEISAHPNLISNDGHTILIPNAQAPKYNNGYVYKLVSLDIKKPNYDTYDKQSLTDGAPHLVRFTKYGKLLSELKTTSSYAKPDMAIFNTFGTGINRDPNSTTVTENATGIARDDLDSIINIYRYGNGVNKDEESCSFPQYRDPKNLNREGRYGYLDDIFVNVKKLIEIVKQSKSTKDIYSELFKQISNSVSGYWELGIIHSSKYLVIADNRHISKKDFENIPIFQFDVTSGTNIIKNVSFSSKASDAQIVKGLAASSNNKNEGEHTLSTPLKFFAGDRLKDETSRIEKPKNVTNFINNSEIIKSLQKPGNGANTFQMTFTNGDKNNIVNLALPHTGLLKSLLADDDEIYNDSINCNVQPGFLLEMTLQGNAGFQSFQCFSFKNFPKPYSDEDVIYQIRDVTQTVTNNNWETKIRAYVRPFAKTVKFTPVFSDGSDL